MVFIDEIDTPELLKASVNGKPGFMVLPQGEDLDELLFTSKDALLAWVSRLSALARSADHAQPYDEWLEDQQ